MGDGFVIAGVWGLLLRSSHKLKQTIVCPLNHGVLLPGPSKFVFWLYMYVQVWWPYAHGDRTWTCKTNGLIHFSQLPGMDMHEVVWKLSLRTSCFISFEFGENLFDTDKKEMFDVQNDVMCWSERSLRVGVHSAPTQLFCMKNVWERYEGIACQIRHEVWWKSSTIEKTANLWTKTIHVFFAKACKLWHICTIILWQPFWTVPYSKTRNWS